VRQARIVRPRRTKVGWGRSARPNCHTPALHYASMGWRELAADAAEHYGVVDLSHALTHVSEEQVRYAVRECRLEPIFPKTGTYRFNGTPEFWEQLLFAASLASGGYSSHKSAARVWGISYVPAQRIELLVPEHQVVRLEGVRAHRSNRIPPHHVTTYAGIPITTGARTLIDLSAVVGDATLERAIDDALRRNVTTVRELHACFNELAGRGRRRIAHLRPLLEARVPGFHPGANSAELRVVHWVVEAGLPKPVQQVWVVAGGNRYCLDFAYPWWKVGWEWDGWEDHGLRRAFSYDRGRRNDLELAGWLMLQFTPDMSRRLIVHQVRKAIEQRTGGLSCVNGG
jgi:predicted transcriptional regulator of viral defense system